MSSMIKPEIERIHQVDRKDLLGKFNMNIDDTLTNFCNDLPSSTGIYL